MLKTLSLINTTNNSQVTFDNYNFILQSYSFDSVNVKHSTSKTTKQVGATVTASNVTTRTLSIVGMVIGTDTASLEANKKILIDVTAPLSEVNVQVTTGEQTYQITTKSQALVQWGTTWSTRNDMYVKFTISLLAPNTLWKDIVPTTVSFEGYDNAFKFPFYSTSSHPLIFGYPLAYKPITLNNQGNTAIGLNFTFTFATAITGFTINNTVTDQHFYIKTQLNAGDTLNICTIFGSKSVTISNGTTSQTSLNCIDLINSTWLQLQPGDNEFTLTCTGGDLTKVTGYLEYTNEYWGII